MSPVTFADLQQQCASALSRPPGEEPEWALKALHRICTAPDRRGWFEACRRWLHDGPATRLKLDREWRSWVRQIFPNPTARRLPFLHLRLITAAAREHWSSRSLPPETVLADIVRRVRLPKNVQPLTMGEVRDLVHELCAPPVEALGSGRHLRPAKLREDGQTPCRVSVQLLLVCGAGGRLARMTFELLANGRGDFYRDPALAMVDFDADFEQSLQRAEAWVRTLHTWPERCDVRWQLEFDLDRFGFPNRVEGQSAGMAIALGMAVLVARPGSSLDLLHAELDLVSATGTLEQTPGQIGRVAGVNLEQKLGPAFFNAVQLGLVKVVVHHIEQRGVPPRWGESGSRLRALGVVSVDQALEKLVELLGPRAAIRRDQAKRHGMLSFLGGRELPMAEGYQQVPLARKLSEQELEQKRREAEERRRQAEREQGGEAGPRGGLRDFVEEPKPYERVPIALAALFNPLADYPHTLGRVLLGAPGHGKTTAGKNLAWQIASGKGGSALSARVPVFVRLPEWGAGNKVLPLEEYLASPGWSDLKQDWPRDAAYWGRLLENGDLFLVLDGFDECPDALSKALPGMVRDWAARMPVLLTCREKNFGEHIGAFGQLPVFLLEPFEAEQRNAFIRSTPLKPERQTALIAHLDRTPAVNALAVQPFLLDALCFVAGASTELPETRCELLKTTVDLLLDPKRGPAGVTVAFPNGAELDIGRRRRLIARVAWALQCRRPGQNEFSEEEFEAELASASAVEHVPLTPDWQTALKRYYAYHARLVALGGRSSSFAHNLLIEFLSAVRLHLSVQREPKPGAVEDGWDRPISANEPLSPRRFIRVKPYERGWNEVIPLFAGLLHNPEPYFKALAPIECGDGWRWPGNVFHRALRWLPKSLSGEDFPDDLCRTRLTFAVRGLGEVTSGRLHIHERTFTTLAREVFKCWHGHRKLDTIYLLTSLEASLSSLTRVRSMFRNRRWQEPFAGALRDPDSQVRGVTDKAVSWKDSKVANQTGILEMLLGCVRDPEFKVRAAGARALGLLASTATNHQGLVESLLGSLRDPNWEVREGAAMALGAIGGMPGNHPGVVEALLGCLRDPNADVRYEATTALGRLGSRAANHPGVIEALLRCLRDLGHYGLVNFGAASALGRLGNAVANQSGVIESLLVLLRDPEKGLRDAGSAALGQLVSTSADQLGVLGPLLVLLRDPDKSVRGAAAMTLAWAELGSTAADEPEVIEALLGCSHDPEDSVRWDAAKALGKLGGAAANHPGVIEALLGCLHDPVEYVRREASKALGKLGRAAADPFGIHEVLLCYLRDPLTYVRWSAAATLFRLGSAAANHPGMVGVLLGCLRDPERYVRHYAIWALSRLGSEAVNHPSVVAALLGCARDPESIVRSAAISAMGQMGSAAANHPGVIEILIHCLRDPDQAVRSATAWALSEPGSAVTDHPLVLEARRGLLRELKQSRNWVPTEALCALGSEAAKLPGVTTALISRLGGLDSSFDSDAARVLTRIGGVAASQSGAAEALIALLRDDNRSFDSMSFFEKTLIAWFGDGLAFWLDGSGVPCFATFPSGTSRRLKN